MHKNQTESFRNCGIFTSIRPFLQPPPKTRYQTLIADLKDTTYKSYWNNEVGSQRDTTGKLPLKINKYSTTFGIKSKSEQSVKSLMTIYENEMSTKYADYCHRKDMLRNEIRPKGRKETLYNPYQSIVKCCMELEPFDYLTVANGIQSNFLTRTSSKLGECRTAFEFPPDSITYKQREKFHYGIEEMFSDNLISKRTCQDYMAYINSLRLRLKYCFTHHSLDFSILYSALRYYDKDDVGWIPYSVVCSVCEHFRIIFDKTIMSKFLEAADILKADYTNYQKFCNVLNWQENFPDKINLRYIKYYIY